LTTGISSLGVIEARRLAPKNPVGVGDLIAIKRDFDVDEDERRFRFRTADCKAITDESGLVDWHDLFSRKGVDLCYDIFYDIILSCFEKFVPKTSMRCTQKFPRVTKELNGLKNKQQKRLKR
jgi:hypothetical protein